MNRGGVGRAARVSLILTGLVVGMVAGAGGCAPELPVAEAGPPNVLLVSMDTVRFDHTSLAGGRDTTPNLAGLARAGVSFVDAYAVGNESLYSHAALFTGRYPSEIAIPDYASFTLPDGVPTLAGVLSAYGYATAAFTGGGHIVATFGFNRGFDSFTAVSGEARFGSFFDSVPPALAWMEGQGTRPWFAFVHGYDAHSPYVQRGPFFHPWGDVGATARIESILADPLAVEQIRGDKWFPDRTPGDFVHAAGRRILATDFYGLPAEPQPGERVGTLSAAEIAHVRDHYDSGLLYGDLWLGVLLSHVNLANTLVIVVADHGEDVLDHGYMNHRAGLWDSTLHVPLVVAGPGFPAGPAREVPVDLRSVLPTVLRAVGGVIPAGARGLALQDRLEGVGPAASPGPVFAEGVMDVVTARDASGRLTIRSARLAEGAPDLGSVPLSDPRVSFASLDTDRDGPVAEGDRAAAEALRAAIVRWRADLRLAGTPGAAIPPELRDALRARGYWTPAGGAGCVEGCP